MQRLLKVLLPLSLLILAAVFKASEPALLEKFRLAVFDTYQRVQPRPYGDPPVKIVAVDDQSLRRLGQWPWERRILAELVDRLTAMGAAVVAFDMMFLEPDRTSPARMVQTWAQFPGLDELKENAGALPDYDAILAASIASGRVTLGYVLTGQGEQMLLDRKWGLVVSGPDPGRFLNNFNGGMNNLPAIAKAAAGNGSLNVIPDADGVVRRLPILLRAGKETVPSFAAEVLRVFHNARSYVVRSELTQSAAGLSASGTLQVRMGQATVQTALDGEMPIYFAGSRPERYVPAWAVLDGSVDPKLIAGQIVLVGVTALGVKDERATPQNLIVPGVEIHAEAIEQILSGDYLVRPDWSAAAELLYVTLLGTILLLALPRLGPLPSALIGASAAGIAAAVSWIAFADWRLVLDPVSPSMIVFAVYLFATLLGFARTEAERSRVRSAFGLYLAPELVRKLAADTSKLNLGGEMRPMTLMFCDIRGFTALSEQTSPQELTQIVNRFFTPMTRTIQDRKGTIDKYIGDCIMAFWNAPLANPAHATDAAHAALSMISGLGELNTRWAAEAAATGKRHLPLRVGIGLNTGECLVGNMGSDQRFNYTAMGDEVNLAARLEGQCKVYSVDIVMSDTTEAAAGDLASLELDLVQMQGKAKPRRIFALLGDETMARDLAFQGLRQQHQAMLQAMRGRDWAEATARLAHCRTLAPATLLPLYEQYDLRLADYAANPPPPEWDGVLVAASK